MVHHREEVIASPCIKVCQMDEASGYCRGCYRTLEEIAFWSVMEPEEKRTVLAQLPARRVTNSTPFPR
jgi:predicted Fe-S protein YdhL (DUF1289 family)